MMGGPLPAAAFHQQQQQQPGAMGYGGPGLMGGLPTSPQYGAQQAQQQQYGGFMAGPGAQQPALGEGGRGGSRAGVAARP
jgi:hypothetical protein